MVHSSSVRLFKLKERYRDVFETAGVLLPRMLRYHGISMPTQMQNVNSRVIRGFEGRSAFAIQLL